MILEFFYRNKCCFLLIMFMMAIFLNYNFYLITLAYIYNLFCFFLYLTKQKKLYDKYKYTKRENNDHNLFFY